MGNELIGNKIMNASFNNIPVLNIRMEFKQYYIFIKELNSKNVKEISRPIDSPLMIWKGNPNDFFTLILQRAILGIESYVPGAVWHMLIETGTYEKKYSRYIKNPYELKGESVPDKYYNSLPSLVRKDISLKECNYDDWKIIKNFYKTVRNPLFHGKLIYNLESNITNPEVILDGYEVINKIYEWVDGWYSPELVWPGATNLKISNN